jgi:uncharacterized protein YndB with AHSA1/START domain
MQARPLVIERIYNAPADKVWQAITDAGKMRQWYFDLKEFRAEPGFKFEFSADCDDVSYLHFCEVTEVVPGRKLTYSWKYKDYAGMSYVTWELFPEGAATRLMLTHTGLETFPPHKDFTKESFTGGWNHFLGTALREFLEK